MPIASTLAYVKQILDGQSVPGEGGLLEAFVAPPDPEITQGSPHAYVWTARGDEKRSSGPRSAPPRGMTPYTPAPPAGWKTQTHNLSIWVVWFDDNTDPQNDVSFPFVVDAVMNILRTTQMPIAITDPATGQQSQLVTLGRSMSYEYAPVRSTQSQRYQRFDAEVVAPTEEWIQA